MKLEYLTNIIRERLAEYTTDGRLNVSPDVLPMNLDSCARDLAARVVDSLTPPVEEPSDPDPC